jgi:hypothetical protein
MTIRRRREYANADARALLTTSRSLRRKLRVFLVIYARK